MALDGGVDGLDFYRRIAKESARFLKPAGLVVVEVGHDQAQKVMEIFAREQFGFKVMKRDLGGVARVLCFGL